MIRKMRLILVMIAERSKEDGLLKTLRRALYSREQAIPVYCDLSTAKLDKYKLEALGCEIRQVNDGKRNGRSRYSLKSRELKVRPNLKKGCRSFVLVKDERIIGDIWYIPPATSNLRPHKDLDLLGIDLGPTDVYAFDLYVSKHERGKDLATAFMGSVLRELRGMGYTRAYGYYLSSNIPALWIHRLIGYKEMPGIGLKRFAFFRRSVPKTGK